MLLLHQCNTEASVPSRVPRFTFHMKIRTKIMGSWMFAVWGLMFPYETLAESQQDHIHVSVI